MNQSILFPGIQSWDEGHNAVRFPAQQSGMLIECLALVAAIERVSGETIEEEQQALTLFSQYRFDMEELAESLIEEEDYDDSGQVVIRK